MQTLLIQKDQLDDLDHAKKEYFNAILHFQNDCVKSFSQRHKDKTLDSLNKLAEMSSYAYDMEILKETTFLQGMVCVFFGLWNDAIKYYKNAVSLNLAKQFIYLEKYSR